MADPLDLLFQEWAQIGGAALVAEAILDLPQRQPEQILADSTAHCRKSGRLTWVVLGWLTHHVDDIDENFLWRETTRMGDPSVLGVLCDAALLRIDHPRLRSLAARCTPPPRVEPFFHRVARSRLALKLTEENALEVFRKWNFLCAELRYL